MDRAQFIEPGTWWLTDPQITDYRIEDVRYKMGALRGWGAEWCTQPSFLEEIFGLIDGAEPQLLQELDYATEPEAQLQWLDRAFTAIYGYGPSEDAGAPGPAAHENGQVETETQEDAAGTADGASASEWDDSWQMLYRLGPTGEYQYAFSDDHVTVRSGAEWMSQEEATAALAASSPAPSAAAPEAEPAPSAAASAPAPEAEPAPSAAAPQAEQESAAGEAEEVDNLIDNILSEVTTDASGLAAELGISEAEVAELVNDPDFKAMVADETSKLLAQ